MRLGAAAIAGAFLLAIAVPAWSAGQSDKDDCKQRDDLERRIRGCTAVIQDQSESERTHVAAYNNRGITYTWQGDFDRAIADLSEAIRLDPTLGAAYHNRGRAYRKKGEHHRAIADLTEAIRLEPGSALPFYERSRAYNNVGDFERAMADISEAIRLDPTLSPRVYLWRGRIYRGRGEVDRAIADFTEAIRLDPSFGYSYLSRGQAYFQAGLMAESLADLDQAIALAPAEPYRWLWRELAARRTNVPSRLHEVWSHLDMTAWPSPVVRLLLGQMTPSAVRAAADDPDPKIERGSEVLCQFLCRRIGPAAGKRRRRRAPVALRVARVPARMARTGHRQVGAPTPWLEAVDGASDIRRVRCIGVRVMEAP
jgi:tetratricopeptide (TPR) repeat protein